MSAVPLSATDSNDSLSQKRGNVKYRNYADIYSHLDANATGEAGMKLGKLLADDEEVK